MTKVTDTKLRDSAFRIESGLPVPPRGKRLQKYPFDEMEVGDSFDAGEYKHSHALAVRNAATRYGKRHSMTFVTRKVDDNRIRCWRVA